MDECPIRNIISRFSGKWPVIILCILSENECTRFNQIQKAIPDISPKVLSDTLKNLETDGIIKRIVYGEVPPRVEYSLTKLGLSLMPYINRLYPGHGQSVAPHRHGGGIPAGRNVRLLDQRRLRRIAQGTSGDRPQIHGYAPRAGREGL